MSLVKAKIVVEELHPSTSKLVLEGNTLVQAHNDAVLRADTLKGMLQAEVDRVNKELERKNAPAETPRPVQYPSAPQAMPPTTEAGEVKLNAFEFSNLLSSLKQVGTSSATNKKVLTHMEIHEQLLAMKVHK